MTTVMLERVVGDQDVITDQVLVDGAVANFTGASAPQLNVRPYNSSSVTSLTAIWTGVTTGNVTYTPSVTDMLVTTAGLYACWWSIAQMPASATPQSGPIFYVLVEDPTGASTGDPVDLCTVQDVKNAFEPAMSVSTRDVIIQGAITAASNAINRRLDRELTPLTTGATRRFYLEPYDLGYRVELDHSDLRSVTTVVLNPEQSAPVTLLGPGNTLSGSSSLADFNLEPLYPQTGTFARLHVSPFLPIFSVTALRLGRPMVDVTGNWGVWSTDQVPNDVRQACVLTVRSWIRQNPAAYAFAEVDHEVGGIAPPAPAAFSIPAGAYSLLRPYERWAV